VYIRRLYALTDSSNQYPAHPSVRACHLGTSFVCDSCSARSRAPAPFHHSHQSRPPFLSIPLPLSILLSPSHPFLLYLPTVHARSHIPTPICDASLAKAFVDASPVFFGFGFGTSRVITAVHARTRSSCVSSLSLWGCTPRTMCPIRTLRSTTQSVRRSRPARWPRNCVRCRGCRAYFCKPTLQELMETRDRCERSCVA
jgi:hypothetical protein